MKTLVARLTGWVSRFGKTGSASKRRLVAEEEMMIAKGREQFQRLLDRGLSIPVAML